MSQRTCVMISSWNGVPAALRAGEVIAGGGGMLEALVRGIGVVEDDPEEMSVGYGGLPNEDGAVELDAAVMDGPMHRGAAVAGLRGVRSAAAVALEVLRRTDHSLLVGEGARRFALALGFKDEDLLTPRSRKAWLDWKASLSDRDAWISPDQATSGFGRALWAGAADPGTSPDSPDSPHAVPPPGQSRAAAPNVPFTFGTIHVSGLDANSDLFACTSTSGLSYKIAGRAGDSPIIGAGLYCDNAVGSAGATGRGESVMQVCGSHAVVAAMEAGRSPTDACLFVLKKIADRTREKRLIDEHGRPNFNVTLYALRKDGETGSASMHEGYEHVVARGSAVETRPCAFLFEKRTQRH
ncbi:MAG: asparaginase [Phycisphaerae bacterium]|nr:N(4)-(beta-N-acetylglucosaminyl)-L-asparaginase [Phycisphaerales bacterium]